MPDNQSNKAHLNLILREEIGNAVADHLAGSPTPELDQLTPDRIVHFSPAQVAAFLSKSSPTNALE